MKTIFIATLSVPVGALSTTANIFDGLLNVVENFKQQTQENHAAFSSMCETEFTSKQSLISEKSAEQMIEQDKFDLAQSESLKFFSLAERCVADKAEAEANVAKAKKDGIAAENVNSLNQIAHEKSKRGLLEAIAQGGQAEKKLCSATEGNTKNSKGFSVLCDTVRQLLQDFNKQLSHRTHEWQNSQNKYNNLRATLAQAIESDQSLADGLLQEASQARADSGDFRQQASQASDILDDVKNVLSLAKKGLATKKKECTDNTNTFNKIMSGLTQFVDILKDDAVLSKAVQHFGDPGEVRATSLLQVSVATRAKSQVTALLRKTNANSELTQRVLAALARGDPFQKVKGLIRKFIDSLEAQIGSSMEQNTYCKGALADNEKKRNQNMDLENRARDHFAKIDATVAELQTDIDDNMKQIAELQSNLASATQQRTKESDFNKQQIMEVGQGQTALTAGRAALAEHGVTQQNAEPIFSFIDVLAVEFQSVLHDAKNSEEKNAEAFKKESDGIKELAAKLESTNEHNSMAIQEHSQKRVEAQGEYRNAQKLLSATLEEFDAQLLQKCLSGGQSFQERELRRQEEITSLKQALEILNGVESAGSAFVQH